MTKRTLCVSAGLAVATACLLLVGCATTTKTVQQPVQTPEEARRDTAKQYYSIGAGYFGSGDTAAAAKNLKRALEYDSTYYDVYLMLGTVYQRTNDAKSAEADYRRAIAVSPRQAKAYQSLGDMLLTAGRDTEALATYKDGLAHDSSNADLYNGVADVYLKWNRKTSADSVYKQAIARFPDELSVVWNWTDFLFRQKRYAEAAASIEPLAAKYPKLPEVRNKLADAYAGMGKFDKAVAQLETLLTLDPGNSSTLLRLGAAYQKVGRLKDASQAYDTLIARDTTQPLPYRFKAEVLIAQNNNTGAEPLLRRVFKLDPHDMIAVADMGDVCLNRAESLVGKNLADVQTSVLDEAIELCNEAKGYYERASSDPDVRDYATAKLAYVDRFLKSLKLERSVR
ncbi:MAG TPA: tetratricopeptide repeat protein [bacterium]|nr:tetratricopeptide repeat protein [bacterium]